MSRELLTIAAQTFEGSRGGIARVCELTARVASEAGYSISLLSVQNGGGCSDEKLPLRTCGGSRAMFSARCWHAGFRGDRVLYDQLGTARAHLRPGRLAKPSGVWIHGIEVWRQPRVDRLRAARRMGFILANTQFTLERAIDYDKAVFGSARVCWLGTMEDVPPSEPAPLDGPPIVLILGRLDPVDHAYKGHKELIEIWPEVVSAVPGARLIMIGTGPSLGWHRSLAAGSRVAELIEVIGFEPEALMPDRWKRAVIFAMPSRGEGFGLAYIEAMRWGVPVIASMHDAGQEVNVHGETGFNVNLDRRNELRDSIVELLRDRDLARRFGSTGQTRWSKHFRYSAFRSRFERELGRFFSL